MPESKIMRVGLTGGIGSGKSVVCRLFGMLGAACYDSDARAKHLMTHDGNIVGNVKKQFGNDIYTPEGSLDSAMLASRVFADKEQLKLLNSIVHPAVMRDFEAWAETYDALAAANKYKCGYVLMESAIILDNNLNYYLDCVITVSAPVELRIARAMNRNGMDRRKVEERISQQMSDCAREVLSDFTIVNDDKNSVWNQVLNIDAVLNIFSH